MLNQHLVHALIGGKQLYCRSPEIRLALIVNLFSSRGHGCS
jgi:hypothetical protein